MSKRVLSLFLALVMVVCMLPAGATAAGTCDHAETKTKIVDNGDRTHTTSTVCTDCGQTVVGERVNADFMAFAQTAKEQDWWAGLRDASVSGIKVIGTGYNTAPMTAAEIEAFSAMKDYLAEHENWMLEEGKTTYGYTHPGLSGLTKGGRRVFINTDTANGDYGLRFGTDRLGTVSDDRDKLVLSVNTEAAGTYELSMDLFNEIGSSPEVDKTSSLCYGNILVNGETVYTDYLFKSTTDAAEQKEVSFGEVELQKGANTIAIQITRDVNNRTNAVTGATNRYSINLRSLTLEPVSEVVRACVDADDDDICDTCGGDLYCAHPGTAEEYKPASGHTHKIFAVCGICGETVSDVLTDCTDEDLDSYCDLCGGYIDTTVVEEGVVLADFMTTVKMMAREDFWAELQDSTESGMKFVGYFSDHGTLSDSELAAYDDMLAWLDENANWNIDESRMNLKKTSSSMRFTLNNNPKYDYAFRLYTDYLNMTDGRSSLYLTVDAEKAGTYFMDLSLHKTDRNTKIDGGWGGGTADIYLNGKLIYDNYSFFAVNPATATIHLGAVELKEGENAIEINMVGDRFGEGNKTSADRSSALRYVKFTPMTGETVQAYIKQTLDLTTSYLRFDYPVSAEAHTVVSSNDAIVSGSINEKGLLVIDGKIPGEAVLYVMEGDEAIATIPVTVEEFTGELDDLGTNTVNFDFVDFAKKAAAQTWWEGFTAGEDESVKIASSTDAAYGDMQAWLMENTRWSFSEAMTESVTIDSLNAAYAIASDKLELAVQVPTAGLYTLNVQGVCADADILVNGETVYGSLACERSRDLGAVWFNKGENTITVDGAAQLRTMVLTPLNSRQAELGGDLYVDLTQTYLPFDAVVSADSFTAASSDTSVAAASIDDDGYLVIAAKNLGTSVITVKEGTDTICSFKVTVIEAGTLHELTYTLDGFKAAALQLGEVAEGVVSGMTTNLTPMVEKQFRLGGSVYFMSSDTSVATVDQSTGDVTCVGEGTVTVTAYAQWEGVTQKAAATLTVTDDTDLAAIEVNGPVGYIGVGNSVILAVSGKKASGVKADMSLYPIEWSVDDETLAAITDAGKLTALKEGTVTVTATVGVMRLPVTASITLEIVENSALAGDNIILDFTYGRAALLKTATVESFGCAINREKTSRNAEDLSYKESGNLDLSAKNVGDTLAIDFAVQKSGWYRMEVRGRSNTSSGTPCETFIGGTYVGIADFTSTPNHNYDGGGYLGTVYLEAGVHTIEMVATKSARHIYPGKITFHAVQDPREISVTLQADKTELVVGETAAVSAVMTDANGYEFFLAQRDTAPEFDNYYILSSSDSQIVSVSGGTLTAVAPGVAYITMTGEILGETFIRNVSVVVKEGSFVSAELTAENTTVKPDSDPVQLTLTTYGLGGTAQSAIPDGVTVAYESGDTAVATVDETGLVTIVGEGSALITATLTEGERVVEVTIWITVTRGKTAPTVYTEEERANARENVLKYSWAWSEKETAVKKADMYLENLDLIYEMWIPEGFPRNTHVGYESDSGYTNCRYCGFNLVNKYGAYPWICDPINNPWKITCPECRNDFPSNDFWAYYQSGVGEDGTFSADKADKSLLTNDLYPEKGEGWGVDDGWGYKAADGTTHTYIAYYLANVLFGLSGNQHSIRDILSTLGDAYLYTGDEKYGSAGAILVDRVADIYPGYDLGRRKEDGSPVYGVGSWALPDGNSGRGKFIGMIWDAVLSIPLAKAADAFWPAMDNPDVIEYLQGKAAVKGVSPEEITPEYVRSNMEENLLLELYEAATSGRFSGNFGMEEAGIAYAAVALDRLPETKEMIEWVFTECEEGGSYDEAYATGGDVMRTLIEDVSRDGLGNEVSFSYNGIMVGYLMDLADALAGYDRVEDVDLWKNQKFYSMFVGLMRTMLLGDQTPQLGETAGAYQTLGSLATVEQMTTAFINTGNVEIAQALYARNGNSTDGIRGDIFTKDPEAGLRSAVQQVINQYGEWDMSDSNMLSGFGIAILREGPQRYIRGVNKQEFSDYWMYFGYSDWAHAQRNALTFDVEAFGLNLSGNMNYAQIIDETSFERMQWVNHTISKNTVQVNDYAQAEMVEGGFPMHFEDAGYAKVMDAEASRAYPETDIYRRTMVTVNNGDGVYYAVDFFRVLGGSEHVYSFHAASEKDPAVEGLEMTKQPMGTYAGADVPFGAWTWNEGTSEGNQNMGSGYSWLFNVSRDDTPQNSFTVDWEIEDFHNSLVTSDGIHMKFTMLSEEPMTEVALADGRPPQLSGNPEHIEYMLVRRSGEEGMDTLFTSVIEPYQFESYIENSELVDVVLLKGTEGITDKAAAIKVTLTSGRTDYIVYATNPDCVYEIDGKFTFQGFAGVVSYEGDALTYAWGNEAVQVAGVIEDAQARVTGTVTDFTKDIADNYYMTITMDEPVSEEELTGRYIYVNNDRVENAAYRIHGAEVDGNVAKLDLYNQTLVRAYVDGFNIDLGYVYNITEGQTYTIPLSASFDVGDLFTYTADQVVKAGTKLTLTTGVSGAGVTYEAEGLPSGAKLNASNGTITWTTSRTQVGRYPVTVKAVQDGEVLGEMSFVIYVVSYTGSTYAADVCAHSKAVTYEVDGMIETVCPACGTVSKTAEEEEEPAQKFDLVGSNMTLGNELKLNFMENTADIKDGYYAVITHNGEVTEAEFAKYNGNYSYVTYTVAAAQMADTISVEVFDADGNAVSNVYETSVRAYAMNMLGRNLSAKINTLLVDMLNYGAAAQNAFGYNTSDLANAQLTDEQKALATESVACTDGRVKGTNYYGSNISLESKILLNVFFKNVTEDMYAEITFTAFDGTEQTVEVPFEEFKAYSGSVYGVVVDDIALAESFTLATVTIYNADGTVHGTATDSVESYIARSASSDLNEAIMKFAASAKAYYS